MDKNDNKITVNLSNDYDYEHVGGMTITPTYCTADMTDTGSEYSYNTTYASTAGYSVTLDVEYRLYNKKTKRVVFTNKVSATSDYSAAITFTGFATEIARKDTYERLADTVAEKMITEILISNLSEYAP